MDTKLVKNNEANLLLTEEQFLNKWNLLCSKCPWATSFQLPNSVCTWYTNYKSKFDPIILIHQDENKEIIGLLFLALSKSKNQLIQAGGDQLEYQGWISTNKNILVFFNDTNRILKKHFQNLSLSIKYLYSTFPIDIIKKRIDKEFLSNIKVNFFDQPLVKYELIDSGKPLLSKSNKSKFNRLKRLGDVEFFKVDDVTKFRYWFGRIIKCYDFRQKAINNNIPFYYDQLKHDFYVDLFMKDLLHVTIMKIDNKLVSAFIGQKNNKEIVNLIPTHDPIYGKYSPGLIHIKLLNGMLSNEGFSSLDLTPGDGVKWKFNHANKVEKVYGIKLNESREEVFLINLRNQLKEYIPFLSNIKLKYENYRDSFYQQLNEKKMIERVEQIKNIVKEDYIKLKDILSNNNIFFRNSLENLLYADGNESIRRDFFFVAMKNIEIGNDVFVEVENKKVVTYIMIENFNNNTGIELIDFYTENNAFENKFQNYSISHKNDYQTVNGS